MTIAECLGLPPYLSVAAPSAQDVRLTLRSFWLIANEFFLLEGFVDLFEHRLITVGLIASLHAFERCLVI